MSTHVPFSFYDARLHLLSLKHISCKETPPQATHTRTTHTHTHHIPVSTTAHDRDQESDEVGSNTPAVQTDYYEWIGREDTREYMQNI